MASVTAGIVLLPFAQACGAGDGGPNVITWWQNPDTSGAVAQIQDRCNREANGRYRLRGETLPQLADAQREQLVRRLAAKDSTVNLLYMDVIWAPEFAEAGWILPFEGRDREQASAGVLKGALTAATWKDKLYAAPWSANSQLLWYRKSLAAQAGIDPSTNQVTWDQIIDASGRLPAGSRAFGVQANRYEGYTVLVNGLVSSAGGSILDNPEAGGAAKPTLNTAAGRRAAEIIRKLARSPAAEVGLSTSSEESTRAALQNGSAWAMVNWPYIYALGRENAQSDPQFKQIFDDYAFARYPRVDPGTPSRPPIGGAMIGVGAYTPKSKLAISFEAAACITSAESQLLRMKVLGEPAARGEIYDNSEIRQQYPFADLIRESVEAAAPRPLTAYYNDVSLAIQRTFHPPSSVDPGRTPGSADDLIRRVLRGKVLL